MQARDERLIRANARLLLGAAHLPLQRITHQLAKRHILIPCHAARI